MPVPIFLAGLLALLITAPLSEPAEAVEAQAGPSMSVELGVGGFSRPDRPTDIRVTLASPVLVAGRVRVSGSGLAVSRAIEVPAGSEQTYDLTVPPLADGTSLTVQLLDDRGSEILSERVTIRLVSHEEMTVGVLGGPDLPAVLGRVRAVVTDRPVSAIELPAGTGVAGFDVLDYLVVGRGADAMVETALAWARNGGRVVVDSALVDADLSVQGVPMGLDGVSRAETGSGSVTVVEGMEGRTVEEWSAILRPTPLDFSGFFMRDDPFQQQALLNAATEAGDRQVPSIPWLLFAIVGFAAVVGPINFIVLSRIGKRDLAWITIPALSLVALVGFWVAGRQRIAGTNLTHASVIVSESEVVSRSAVVVAAGTAGERRLEVDEGYRLFPEMIRFGSEVSELRIEGDSAASIDLQQLGFTGIGLARSAPEMRLPQVTRVGDSLSVDNTSDIGFWAWGAVAGNGSVVASGELASGETGEVQVPVAQGAEFGWTFIDSVINQGELWNDQGRSSSLWSLSQVLTQEVDPGHVYFVGLTDDFRPGIAVEGNSTPAEGPTLVLIRAEGGEAPPSGTVTAEVVDTGFVNWVDWGWQRVISTDEMTVAFRLPDPALEVRLVDRTRFGVPAAAYEAWHWGEGGFQAIQPGDRIPAESVSPDGQIYVRLIGANEFGDNPMSPDDLALEWGA